MGNMLDRTIAWFSPSRAVRRAHARKVLSYYEAGKPDRQRKQRRESGSGDTAVLRAGTSLREQARHFDQNHDISRGVLNTLVQNIVGPHGIGVEFQPRTSDGDIHDDTANRLQELWRQWSRRPEATWDHDWASAQRIMARTWLRDGEALSQILRGTIRGLLHGSRVPFSLELIEPDLLPLNYNTDSPNITAGVERNGWNRPVAFHILKEHPGNASVWNIDTKRVSADRILHLKLTDRIGQSRGVSIFASVMSRIDDIKDYEESERIAAKVAASMAAYIKKGAPDTYDAEVNDDGEEQARDLRFAPGMVFDDLEPGEEIGTIDTTRPNSNLEPHRNGQLRALSAGTGVTYSSCSKDYNGTYSAQRQELVEGWGAYGVLASEFISQFVRPVQEQFVAMCELAGLIEIPDNINRETLDDALFIPPQMPWIDPLKEANSWVVLEGAGYASGPEIIRRRGGNPRDVIEQESRWKRMQKEKGISTSVEITTNDTDEEGNTNAKTRISL
jgi:lambda family phage portal protein